jgi:hypothetical protein
VVTSKLFVPIPHWKVTKLVNVVSAHSFHSWSAASVLLLLDLDGTY